MEFIYTLPEIENIAKQILVSHPGDKIFCFDGDLGAGKTTFIEAICRLMKTNDDLSSPTFSIVNEYKYPQGIIAHMDWYRIRNYKEAIDAGIEQYLQGNYYCFIEWYQHAIELLPNQYVLLKIETIDSKTRRLTSERILC